MIHKARKLETLADKKDMYSVYPRDWKQVGGGGG